MTGDIKQGIFVDFRFQAVKHSLPSTPEDDYVVLLDNFVSLNDINLMTGCGYIHSWVTVPNSPVYGDDDEGPNVFQIALIKEEEMNLFKISFNHIIVAFKKFKDIG